MIINKSFFRNVPEYRIEEDFSLSLHYEARAWCYLANDEDIIKLGQTWEYCPEEIVEETCARMDTYPKDLILKNSKFLDESKISFNFCFQTISFTLQRITDKKFTSGFMSYFRFNFFYLS